MHLPWFRFYTEFASDPVVQSLAFEDQRHYVILLCLKGAGVMDRAISQQARNRIILRGLGLDAATGDEVKRRLIEVDLIDKNWSPMGWEERQFSSDISTERVRKYRESKETRNVAETQTKRFVKHPPQIPRDTVIDPPLDTDTDTDTDPPYPPKGGKEEPSVQSKVIPTGGPAGAKKRASRRPPIAKSLNGAEAWEAYTTAYRDRYGVEPVRNAKTNACISRLASHLPAMDTADVIRWYLRHNDAVYVRAKHCVELLLRDAEGLHTEMARGEPMTSRRAREVDSLQTSVGAVEAVIKKHPEWSK